MATECDSRHIEHLSLQFSWTAAVSQFFHTHIFLSLKKKGLNGRSRAEAFFSQKENCFSQTHAETQKMFCRSIFNHRRLDYRKQSSRPLDFKDSIL